MDRLALEKDLKAAQRRLREVEQDRDGIAAAVEELRARKDPASVATLPARKAQSARITHDLLNITIGAEMERLSDAEVTVQAARDEVARIERELERCERLALADRLEGLDRKRGAAAERVDQKTIELVEAHEAHRAVLAEIAETDKALAHDVMARHVRRGPARSGACFHGLSRYVPTDHYTAAVPFVDAAVAPEPKMDPCVT